MASPEQLQHTREILERVSRVVEGSPGLDARSIRVRARVSRRTGDEALELLHRGKFLERRWVDGDWCYTSSLPCRADDHTPAVAYGASHSASQGGVQ